MKKNITINLFGQLYNIDEDAYELLRSYQDNMRVYFSQRKGGEEVADDVERRVAELFNELKEQGVQALTIEHVKTIIERIGEPQQMEAEQDNEEQNPGPTSGAQNTATPPPFYQETSVKRRLYRNPNDKMLGGVVSGIVAYFRGTDTTIWRIIFVLLCIFTGTIPVVVYFVMWLVIPEAYTAEERLQMQGKPINMSNIRDEVFRENEQARYRTAPANSGGCLTLGLKILLLMFAAFLLLIFGSILLGILVGIMALILNPFSMNTMIDYNMVGISDGLIISNSPAFVFATWCFYISALFFFGILVFLIIRWFIYRNKQNEMSQKVKLILVVIETLLFIIMAVLGLILGNAKNRDISYDNVVENSVSYKGNNEKASEFLSLLGWNSTMLKNVDEYVDNRSFSEDGYNYDFDYAKIEQGQNNKWGYTLVHEDNVNAGSHDYQFLFKAEDMGNRLEVKVGDSIAVSVPLKEHQILETEHVKISEVMDYNGKSMDKDLLSALRQDGWKLVSIHFDVPKTAKVSILLTNIAEGKKYTTLDNEMCVSQIQKL